MPENGDVDFQRVLALEQRILINEGKQAEAHARMEARMASVVEKLETHTHAMDQLLPKIERLLIERGDDRMKQAMLDAKVSQMDTDLKGLKDSQSKEIGELKTTVNSFKEMYQQGKGFRAAINALLAAITGAATLYGFLKANHFL